MFARQMHGNPFEDLAISPQSGEAGVLRGEYPLYINCWMQE